MIQAIIVDDETLSRETLSKLIEMHCPSVKIIAECENAEEAAIQTEKQNPDLVFLDVAMPGKNGIEFLAGFPGFNFEVIFVTAHDRYVLQALRLSAADYLSKPVVEEELISAVNNVQKRIIEKKASQGLNTFLQNMAGFKKQEDMQLCVPGLKGFQVFSIPDIIYCEAENTYTYIFLKDGKKILASRPLMDYENLLQDAFFFRIHKSTLVNMKHIKEYQKGEGGFVIMSNGASLEVSRRKKESFVAKMKEVFKY
jgi:two-component system LytT family response regulator